MNVMTCLISIVAGYFFGMFQTAYLYGKKQGVDIRKVGSGNAGTTNALRAFGTKAGAIVFAGDFLKCVIAILVMRALFAHGNIGAGRIIGLYTGLGCILGHNFPFYLQFKGGKGIACSLAVLMMFSFPLGLIALAAFIAVFSATNYVSLGSLTGVAVSYLAAVLAGALKLLKLTPAQYRHMVIVLAVISALAVWQHRSNISRLISHTENKIYLFKKK